MKNIVNGVSLSLWKVECLRALQLAKYETLPKQNVFCLVVVVFSRIGPDSRSTQTKHFVCMSNFVTFGGHACTISPTDDKNSHKNTWFFKSPPRSAHQETGISPELAHPFLGKKRQGQGRKSSEDQPASSARGLSRSTLYSYFSTLFLFRAELPVSPILQPIMGEPYFIFSAIFRYIPMHEPKSHLATLNTNFYVFYAILSLTKHIYRKYRLAPFDWYTICHQFRRVQDFRSHYSFGRSSSYYATGLECVSCLKKKPPFVK